MSKFAYRPEIDGLRALAVVSVVLYHIGAACSGGFVGVDIFFVISGYLISAIILRDHHAKRFSLREFWARRVRRIIPLAVIVMFATLVAGWFVLWPEDYGKLGGAAASQALSLANVYYWLDSGYFTALSETKPLLHMWSLAIEGQFYVFFPLFLAAVFRWGPSQRQPLVALIAISSFAMAVYGTRAHPSANFYLLPTRAWELLLGALLALGAPSANPLPPRAREPASWIGIVMILASVFFYDERTPFPGLAALPPCLGAALIIHSSTGGQTRVSRLLSVRPVVFLGAISYSLYLWHWPILVLSEYWAIEEFDLTQRLGLAAISTIVAAASWRWIETPFRNRSTRAGRLCGVRFWCAASLALFALGLAIWVSGGMPRRISPEVRAYADGAKDRRFVHNVTVEEARRCDFVSIGSDDETSPVRCMVWGDSHAIAIMPAFDALCREHKVRGMGATYSSTAPLIGYESNLPYALGDQSTAFADHVIRCVESEGIRHVILVALWSGTYRFADEPEVFRQNLETTIAAIQRAGATPWIMIQVPLHSFDVPRTLARAGLAGLDVGMFGTDADIYADTTSFQRQVFAEIESSGAIILDPANVLVSADDRCIVSANGKALYSDSHHLSTQGALLVKELFRPIFEMSQQPTR